MRKYSVKTNTVFHSSKLSYQKLAINLIVSRPKGVSSHQLAKDLCITQKSAWHLGRRIRKALEEENLGLFIGPAEVDETFIGGRARSQTRERKERLEKMPVAGMRDRETNQIIAHPVRVVKKRRMHHFVESTTERSAEVYTDEARVYKGIFRRHSTVNHSSGQYGLTNVIESFWALLKRGYIGTYHLMSPKHLRRYVTEFAERHNRRPLDAIDNMRSVVKGGVGKQLRYKDLIDDKDWRDAA